MITAAPGLRSSMISLLAQSAVSPSHHLILMLFMLVAAKVCKDLTCPWETEFTDQQMRAVPGCTWVCAMGNRFLKLPLIRVTPTRFWSPSPAILTDQTKSAASFVRLMEVRLSPGCCPRTRILAALTCCSIQPTRPLRTLPCGRRDKGPGRTAPGMERAAAYTSQRTVEERGFN